VNLRQSASDTTIAEINKKTDLRILHSIRLRDLRAVRIGPTAGAVSKHK